MNLNYELKLLLFSNDVTKRDVLLHLDIIFTIFLYLEETKNCNYIKSRIFSGISLILKDYVKDGCFLSKFEKWYEVTNIAFIFSRRLHFLSSLETR